MRNNVTYDSSSPEVLLTVSGGIAEITLNRPEKLNSVTPEMSQELSRLAHELNHDPNVRVVIVTGAGERSFCAGSDIRTLDSYETAWDFRNRRDYCDAFRDITKPMIAAINGYAFGGGLETALTCDIRLASETATFAASEIKLGWIGGGGVSAFLTNSAGPSNAALMLLTGDPIPATIALQWGIISEVVQAGELMSRARELSAIIASRPPIAAEHAKVNIRAAMNMSLDDSRLYERDIQTVAFATEDAAEGRLAFAEKRPGIFRRR
jgi:enoyl-CoA hydratase/carnithine racemase